MEETIMKSAIAGALNCTNEEFTEKYNAYKKEHAVKKAANA